MKKFFAVFLSLVLMISMVTSFASCKGKKNSDGNNIDVTLDDSGNSISLDESTVKTLLSAYSKKSLGLSKDIEEYSFIITASALNGKNGCKAEAYIGNEKNIEGTFFISGTECYVYNKNQKKYIILKVDGNKEGTTLPPETWDSDFITETIPGGAFSYNKNNNDVLAKKFSKYTPESLGLKGEVKDYIYVAEGSYVVASDGKTVFIVWVYTKTGEKLDVNLAFNDAGEYTYDSKDKIFKLLKAPNEK